MLRVSPSKGANVRATLQNFESSLARFNTHLKVPSSCWRFQIDRFSSLVQDSGFEFSIPGVLHHLTIELIVSVQRPHVRFTVGVVLDGYAFELIISKLRTLDRFSLRAKPVRVAI